MNRSILSVLKVFFLAVVIIILPACDLAGSGELELTADERAQTLIAETLAVEQAVQTGIAETMAVSVPTEDQADPEITEAVITDTPTITPSPTVTLTPTPSVPLVSVSVNTNCRRGPGSPYDIVGTLLVGGQAEVVGIAANGGYWIIKNPNQSGECWLWDNYATVAGQTSGLPLFTPPPTPTPTPNWTGTWTTSWGVTGFPHFTYIINFTQTNASVDGTFNVGGNLININGTLSVDYMTLTGTWASESDSGPFAFKLLNMNQFVGNMNNGEYEWCGHRAGAGLPSPCMGP
jgi:hypothetical protein